MMSEENMEMGIPYDFTTPWNGGGGMGGFQKLLTSPIFYDPEQAELLLPGYENSNDSNNNNNNNNCRKFNGLNCTQVQGGAAEQESCVTAVGFQSRSNSEAAEDVGVSDTATQEEQQENPMMNAENMALAIPNSEKGEGDAGKRRKRKRVKAVKNSEEVESQRMTHIEVERNRRKQMNEHLGVLRSLIPDSYVQRGDQASIIGGAIDLVKELEQVLQSLQLQKIKKDSKERRTSNIPQNCLITPPKPCSARSSNSNSKYVLDTCIKELREAQGNNNTSTVADIEVTLIESHASIKILSRKRPGQLVNVITALESLHMTTLHLNITTIDQTVMFSFNIKVEDECKLTSANEIATALHQILRVVHSNDRNHALN